MKFIILTLFFVSSVATASETNFETLRIKSLGQAEMSAGSIVIPVTYIVSCNEQFVGFATNPIDLDQDNPTLTILALGTATSNRPCAAADRVITNDLVIGYPLLDKTYTFYAMNFGVNGIDQKIQPVQIKPAAISK